MTRAEAKVYRNKVIQGEQVEKLGGITEKVEQDNPVGTANNPFIWSPGMRLIPNGYYTYGGRRYVAIAEGSPETITEEYLVEF